MPAQLLFYPLLAAHILAGLAGLTSGLAAIAARKGGPGHGRAGKVYLVAMLTMTASAAVLTLWEPDRLTLISALWTAYLVVSAYRAAWNRHGETQLIDWALLLVGTACAALFLNGGMIARSSPDGEFQGMSSVAFFVFGAVASLAALLDAATALRPLRDMRARIGRHLWRMCAAYFLAATSLFLGQQDDVFPFMAGSPILLAPSLLTLAVIAFWLARMRFAQSPLKAWPRPSL